MAVDNIMYKESTIVKNTWAKLFAFAPMVLLLLTMITVSPANAWPACEIRYKGGSGKRFYVTIVKSLSRQTTYYFVFRAEKEAVIHNSIVWWRGQSDTEHTGYITANPSDARALSVYTVDKKNKENTPGSSPREFRTRQLATKAAKLFCP
jgi:hypothetical protein